MSLSFEDSLKNNEASIEVISEEPIVENLESNDMEAPSVMAYSMRSAAVLSDALADDGNWRAIADKGYKFYDNEYADANYSSIDEKKNIILDESQFNITQEKNSQYIPFQMPRFYDGFDLKNTKLGIYYVNKNRDAFIDTPVDVYYNDNYIRFAWLVSAFATQVAGVLQFEIHAVGTNSKGESYTWKSKSIDKLNVLQSLEDVALGEIGLGKEEVESWYNLIVEASNAATNASVLAQHYAEEAAKTYSELQDGIADEVQTALNNTVGDVVENQISERLKNYYTTEQTYSRTEIDDKIAAVKPDGYATEKYVDDEITAVNNKFGTLVDSEGADLTVEAFVKQEVEAIDVSDELGDLGTNEDGTKKTVVQYVDEAVASVDVSDQLGDLGEKTVKQYVDDALDNISLDGYATTSSLNEVKASLETVSGNTVTNATNIATAQADIAAIQSTLNSLEGDNKNLIIQYDEVGSILHLYEKDENGDITITDGEEQIKVKEIYSTIITGAGGGGNSLVSTIKLGVRPDGTDSLTVLYGDATSLNYNLSTRKAKETQDDDGNDVTIYEEAVIAGDITFTLYRDNVYLTHFTVTKTSSEVQKGSIDISDYIVLGNQVFTITASYVEQLGSDGDKITIRSSADWAVNAVKLDIANLPDSTWETAPKYGSTTFSYTPIGALEKTIYFKIDDEEPDTVVTTLNGTGLTYTIPEQTHGVHTLQVWCEGYVGETLISTKPRKYVLMFVEEGNNTPIIRIKAPTTLEQYSSDYIYYNVLDPLNAIIKSVTIYDEDNTILSSVENITSAEQKWEFRPSVVKDKTITIKYKEITESVTITVTKFPYEINAVTDSLMVDFVPTGRTNSDVDYNVFKNNAYIVEKDKETGVETQKEIPMTWTFSDNFDWVNGGWKIDENGDAYFCVKSGTSVDFNYNLFGTDGVVAKKDANGDYKIAGTGKEFKLIFKTANVAQANANWLQCVDVADKKSLGIRMEAQNAYIDSSLGTLEIPYVDNDIIEFDMNIVPVTKFLDNGEPNLKVKAIPMIITYEDGTPVQPKVISSATTNFKQDTPQPITIGSDYCDVHIYRMKVYERYLDDKEIITNFIADARSGVEMAKRYVKNDIYPIDDKQKITPESVAAACPDLKVYVLSAPYFTNDKGNKVENTTIKQIHNTGTKEKPEYDASENWTATNATHNGQGTSSNEYGYAGRNLEFNMKKATITLNDNTTVVKEIQLSPTSYPTNYLNFKINIASSEHSNNALLQKRYDRYLPYTSVASLIDNRKKNSMEFFNCVVFIQETDEDISTHREFADTNVHFYGIGNIGDSKKTDASRVNDPDDPKEFCVEIMDWNRYLSSFPADTMVSTLYTDDDGKQVLRFEDFLVDDNLGADGILYEKDNQSNYYHSTDTTVDKTKTYYIDILENDDFSEDYTYGFRYIQKEWKKDDDADYKAKNEAFQKPLRQKWIEFYRYVTRDLTTNGVEDTAKVEDWKSEFSHWFISEAAWYYYLYTLRYTMADNRAKNTFWHWGKHYLTLEEALTRGIAVYDEDKNLITDTSNPPSKFYDVNGKEIKNINEAEAAINDGYRMDFWDYDNDTALGIDNAGKLEIPVGVEDSDIDFAGVPYFRAHDSLVFVRISKYFAEELEDTWHNTEINPVGKVFDSTGFINEFDAWQNQFPEDLWRIAYERQYKRTYVGGTGIEWDNALPQSNQSDIVSTRFLTEMMNGRKKYQRRCFERNQEIYMSSKFKGEVNLNDTITLRGTGKPTGKVVAPNFTLNIAPFSKMYVNLYSATDKIYYHEKCEAGQSISIPYPETTLDFIYIRGASQVQSLGDLSPMYLQTAELTSGAKLQIIKLGNATSGYSNDSLQTLQIGAGNKLLEELDIRNLSNFNTTTLPVSNIPSLRRVYAQGSNISEAVFANNGLLEEAYLPDTITRLELRNLHYLKTISCSTSDGEESYENLLHLVVMNCPTMNDLVLDMINQASDLKTLRVTNVDWKLDNADVLKRLYNLIKTPDSPEVILTGNVYVPTIKDSEYNTYRQTWSDLNITYSTKTPQYLITFVNDDEDETVLCTQWVDEFQSPIDPVANGDIPTPTKESTVSTSYTYSGWNVDFSAMEIDEAKTFKAVYTDSPREYKIQYIAMDSPVAGYEEPVVGHYGDNMLYNGEIPRYTKEEGARHYYLFNRWDNSGFLLPESENDPDYVNGVKIVNAIFDDFEYTSSSFTGKKLDDLEPVEIYALTKLTETGKTPADFGMIIEDGDRFSFAMGYDIDFNDIESEEIISQKRTFTGATNDYLDTGLYLFDEDKDFVLALDYTISKDNESVGTFMQCFQTSGSNGFKLGYNGSSSDFVWGSSISITPSSVNNREMLVIRHKKGDKNLYVYVSNLDSTKPTLHTIERSSVTKTDSDMATLIFGAAKMGSNRITNYCMGDVYWCKIWWQDLGEKACEQLAGWTHEKITFGVSGFYRYPLYDDRNKETTVSLIASHLLDRKMKYNSAYTNKGGWAASDLNKILNTRFYDAIPVQIRLLLKKMCVLSTIGQGSSEVSESGCYVNIPAVCDVVDSTDSNYKNYIRELYSGASTIASMATRTQRRREFRYGFENDNINAYYSYWLRSPNFTYSSNPVYVWRVNENYDDPNSTSRGTLSGISQPNDSTGYGVLIEISF